MKRITILGSTGSIGTQTLDVVRKNKDKFEVVAISANSSVDLLLEQILEFSPKYVAVYNEESAAKLKDMIPQNINIEVLSGMEGLVKICELDEVDVVLTAVVGMIGLVPTMAAIKAKKTIALANKETLVTAGELVMSEAKKNNVKILPVDSEHSAIFQCLNGERHKDIEKIILTASGGPFIGKKKEDEITLSLIIKNEEDKLFKEYSIKNNLYNEKSLLCIIGHYRNLIKTKIVGGNLLAILSIAVPILLSFYTKEGFDFNGLANALPYLISFSIMIILLYFSYNQFIEAKKFLKGEDGMIERLEEIFSELYVEYINESNVDKIKKKETKNQSKKKTKTLKK